ncbi:hypothetical protein U1Q18_040794 [Sarracenia purpurea var. burkii]
MKGILVESGGDDRSKGDDDSEKGEEVEMADLLVKSATVEVGLANQRLKNAEDVRDFHHRAKDRVIGRGNNLLGTVPALGGGARALKHPRVLPIEAPLPWPTGV